MGGEAVGSFWAALIWSTAGHGPGRNGTAAPITGTPPPRPARGPASAATPAALKSQLTGARPVALRDVDAFCIKGWSKM